MNSKLNAYKQAAMMKTDYRSQEANLFKRVTFGLIQGKANPNGMDLVRAASDNKLVWMTIIKLLATMVWIPQTLISRRLPMSLVQRLMMRPSFVLS